MDWSIELLSGVIGKGHCGPGSPSYHDCIPQSKGSKMRLEVRSFDFSTVSTDHHFVAGRLTEIA